MSPINARVLLCIMLSAYSIDSLSMNATYTADNTQFAFDFHDVVVSRNINRIKNAIFNRTFLYKIHFNRYIPGLLWALARAACTDTKGGTGEVYVKILQDYHQPDIAQLTLDLANDVDPIEGTVTIIKELKTLGYEVNIASDIGKTVLENLKTREKYRPLLSLFDHEQSVDYIHANGHPVQKPQLAYFNDYLQKFQDNKQYIIFIDDKEKNVIGASNAGMIGIVFKNPSQLRAQLVTMGILQ